MPAGTLKGWLFLRWGMDWVGLGLGLGAIIIGMVIIWRIFVIEENLNTRIDELDRGLGAVVGNIIERMDAIGANVPDINLINQNPIGQIIEFLRGQAPSNPNGPLMSTPPPRDESTGQYVEVESHAPQEKENDPKAE